MMHSKVVNKQNGNHHALHFPMLSVFCWLFFNQWASEV